MLEIKSRKEFIEHFGVKVIPCGRDKKPYGKWNEATINSDIASDCYACFAGGTRYKGGVIVVVDLDNHNGTLETGRTFWDRQLMEDETFTVRTPSGGEHLYFLAAIEQICQLEEISKTGTRLAEEVEIFWNGKHLNNGPFSQTNVGNYTIEKCLDLAPLPERVIFLYQKIIESKKKTSFSQRSVSNITEMEQRVIIEELECLASDGEFDDYDTIKHYP